MFEGHYTVNRWIRLILPSAMTALISFFVSLLLIELLFRLCLPQENLYLYEVRNHVLVNRPFFSDRHAMRPELSLNRLRKLVHYDTTTDFASYVADVETNSQGFRAPNDYSTEKKNQGLRILALGDSITFGWPFPVEKSYPSLMQIKIPESEVINCSVIGANTLHLEKIYAEECSKFQVDVVVLQITLTANRSIPDYFWSDFAGSDERLYSAVWSQKEESLEPLQTQKPQGLPHLSLDMNHLSERQEKLISETYRPHLPLYRNFHFLRFIENSWLVKIPQLDPLVRDISAYLQSPEGEAQVLANLKKGIHPSLQVIQRLNQAVQARHARFLVVIIPNKLGLENVSTRPDLPLILQKLNESSIPVLDLSRELSSPARQGSYLPDDVHPNEKGYDWIAEKLSEKIRSLN